jgi:hypothetical protein
MTNDSNNRVESGIKYLFGYKWIARMVIFYFCIVGIGNFVEGIDKINTFTYSIVSKIAAWSLDKHTLIDNARSLAKEMRAFLSERSKSEPPYATGSDIETWQKNTDIRRKYDEENKSLFNQKFQADTIKYYSAFQQAGLSSEELDSYTKSGFIFDLTRFPNALDSLAAELEIKLASTTNATK